MSRRVNKRNSIDDELAAERLTKAESIQERFDQEQAIFEEKFNSEQGTNISFIWTDKTTDDVSSPRTIKRVMQLSDNRFLKKYGHWGGLVMDWKPIIS